MFQIAEVLIVLAAVGKFEESLEVVELLFVDSFQQLHTDIVLGQQTLLDHFGHVGTGKFEAIGKARLDTRKVVALLLAHITHHGVHILLCCDDNPRPTQTLGGQTFSHSL
ncbi:hypothetical protein D3C77_331300 [compost metagenome]